MGEKRAKELYLNMIRSMIEIGEHMLGRKRAIKCLAEVVDDEPNRKKQLVSEDASR
jgi:hypothetical protein